MDIQTLSRFFKWCAIINGSMLVLWTIMLIVAPDLVYKTQNTWFEISRESFNIIIYAFLGLYKIFFLVFNIVPYVALRIIRYKTSM